MKIDQLDLHIPLDYCGTIVLEDEIESLPENFTRKDVLKLITRNHFEQWMESVMDGMCASWDKESFVESWQKDNASDHRKIAITADGTDNDGERFLNKEILND